MIAFYIFRMKLNFQMLSIHKHLWICPDEQISPEGNLETVCFDSTVVIRIWLISWFQAIMSTLCFAD